MITHVVSFRWKSEITPQQVARIRLALESLPGVIPEIASYRCGPDLGANATGNMDFAVVATFDSIEGWRVYDAHPEHDRVRAEVIRPWIAERAAVQFQN